MCELQLCKCCSFTNGRQAATVARLEKNIKKIVGNNVFFLRVPIDLYSKVSIGSTDTMMLLALLKIFLLNIKIKYELFKQKHPNVKVSY